MYPRILVVDDEIAVCKLLYNLLEDEGEVECASSSEAALEKINASVFDLIISEIRIPGLDGFELLKQIRTMNIDSEVIFLTGCGSVNSAIEAIRLGVVDYIEKPFDTGQLKSLVSQILGKQRFLHDIAEDKLLFYTLSQVSFDSN